METFSVTNTSFKQRTNTFWNWRLADPYQRLFDHSSGVPLVRYGVCGPKWFDSGECEAAKVKTALGAIADVQIWEDYTVQQALDSSDCFRAGFYLSLDSCLQRLRGHIEARIAAKKTIGPWYFPLS